MICPKSWVFKKRYSLCCHKTSLNYQNIIETPVNNSNPFEPPLANTNHVEPPVINSNPCDLTPDESVVAQSSLIDNNYEHWNNTTPNFKPMDDANNEDEFTLGND